MKISSLYIFFTLCCLNYPLSPSIAQSQIVSNTPIWRSAIQARLNQITISGQENNFKISLIILVQKPSLLRISYLNPNNINDISFLNFSIGKQNFILTKQHNKNLQNQIEFETNLSAQQLNAFTQDFTSKESAFITFNHSVTPISLAGTSSIISTLLRYLDQNPISELPPPFGKIPSTHSNSLFTITAQYNQLLYGMGSILFLLLFGRPIFIVLRYIYKYTKKRYGVKKAYKIATYEINQHANILYIKRDQLLYKDDYGTIVQEKWLLETQRFIKTKIKPALSNHQVLNYYPHIQKKILKKILYIAKYPPNKQRTIFNKIKKTKLQYSPTINPIEYETYCAELLRQSGWNAKVTTASGDQGADVIAFKKEITLIIQCKLYSKPVGNKAVQEVNAAKIFYHAHYAAVVSNASYTTAARQLAESTKIELLHHEILQQFADSLI